MMILILTVIDDRHANHVAAKLRERGAPFVRFDPGQFPRGAEIAVSNFSCGDMTRVLRVGELNLDLADVRAVWYRRPTPPTATDDIVDMSARELIERECRDFMHDLWTTLDCEWLPAAPATVKQAARKASQLALAGRLGFELPPTLITNSPDEVFEFFRRHDGHIISKLLGPAFSDTVGRQFVRYTERVTLRDIAHAHSIRYCPLILQAYVPKRLELRITVVGEQVFAAEIHSQTANRTRHDWRRYDFAQTPYYVHELPANIERRCVELVHRLGLQYGAIDMVLTPDGRYVFLEINPNGQYLWVEDATGLPISDAICDSLIRAACVGKPDTGSWSTTLGGCA